MLPGVTHDDTLRICSVVVEDLVGVRSRHRLSADANLGVVVAMHSKQRVRKMLEYHHADWLSYATEGAPNRLEHGQGLFVKLGDGVADVKPIAHPYKPQVYALSEHPGAPEKIRARSSTTDTYSLEQTQKEFYFSLPDRLLVPRDIDQKRHSTRDLHEAPVLVDEIPQVGG